MSQDASIPASRKAPAIWPFFLIGLLMLLLFWGVNKWLVGFEASDAEPEEAARAELRIKNLAELRAENATKLESYAWVDRAKGTVQIPIAEAMNLVLADLNASEPRAAYPVVAPAVAPAVAPEASPAPAPTESPAAAPAAPTAPATPTP